MYKVSRYTYTIRAMEPMVDKLKIVYLITIHQYNVLRTNMLPMCNLLIAFTLTGHLFQWLYNTCCYGTHTCPVGQDTLVTKFCDTVVNCMKYR